MAAAAEASGGVDAAVSAAVPLALVHVWRKHKITIILVSPAGEALITWPHQSAWVFLGSDVTLGLPWVL